MDDQTYQQERKFSLDAEYSDVEHYDKWLLTLSAGGFAISIGFLQNIVPNPTQSSKVFLIAAWASLLLSILATMSSMQFSQWAFRRYRQVLDDEMEQGAANANTKNIPAAITNMLNWISLVLFIVGAAMLAVFSFLNLGGKP